MDRFQIAHVHEQDMALIIVPLDDAFRHRSALEQLRVRAALQASATIAGLDGSVVPVWDAGDGRMAFLAPLDCHPFLSGIDLAFVFDHINGELACNG